MLRTKREWVCVSGRPPNPNHVIILHPSWSQKHYRLFWVCLFYNRVKSRVYFNAKLFMVETNHYYKRTKGSVELLTK